LAIGTLIALVAIPNVSFVIQKGREKSITKESLKEIKRKKRKPKECKGVEKQMDRPNS
jgi:hypothetical protein